LRETTRNESVFVFSSVLYNIRERFAILFYKFKKKVAFIGRDRTPWDGREEDKNHFCGKVMGHAALSVNIL
jgi:hypothetical protein